MDGRESTVTTDIPVRPLCRAGARWITMRANEYRGPIASADIPVRP
jgi:hypothetical protein